MTKATYGARPQQVVDLLTKMGPSTPSFVQQTLGLKATGYVYALLNRMTKQGLLKRENGKYAAIEGAKPKRITITKRKGKARQGVVVAKSDNVVTPAVRSLAEENNQLKIEILDLRAVIRYLETRLGTQN